MDMLGATVTSSGSTRSCEDTVQLEVVMEIAESQNAGVIGASASVEPLRPLLYPHPLFLVFPSLPLSKSEPQVVCAIAVWSRGFRRNGNLKPVWRQERKITERMTTPHDFPELKNDLLLRAARGGVPIVC